MQPNRFVTWCDSWPDSDRSFVCHFFGAQTLHGTNQLAMQALERHLMDCVGLFRSLRMGLPQCQTLESLRLRPRAVFLQKGGVLPVQKWMKTVACSRTAQIDSYVGLMCW